jgi:effector-binding domain-containing protein
VQQLIASEQTRLARIEARLKQIEDDSTVAYAIILKQVKAQKVAAIRDVLPTCSHIKQLHTELGNYLQSQAVKPADFPQAVWHDPEYRLHEVDAEAVILINQRFVETERVVAATLPAVEQMACVVHHGNYEGVIQAYNALLKWIELNNYQVAGSNREVYLPPTPIDAKLMETIAQTIIEIQFPVDHA